jgi:D-alanyl-D-alanine carboxypeptidase (penicillin-binding protein 5/6)
MTEILSKKENTIKKLIAGIVVCSVVIITGLFFLFRNPVSINKTLNVSDKSLDYKATLTEKISQEDILSVVNPSIVEDDKFPVVSARSAFFVNLEKNEILYNKDPRKRVPIASIVKIMTAVVAVEHAKLNSPIVVSEGASLVGENAMGISSGEVYSLEDLLYGLILHSGNDSAVAIAEGVAGREETFVKWMNVKALELGLKDTLFSDSSGLNQDGKDNYSTAWDVAIISEYSLRSPVLAKIFATYEYEIPQTEQHKYLYLQNQTNLLTTYPGVAGIKTGYTEEAGLCLVTYAKNDGKKVLGVILGSQDRRGDAILLLNYSFEKSGFPVNYPI